MRKWIIAGVLILTIALPATNAAAISMQGVGLAAGPAIPGRDPSGFHYVADGGTTINDTAQLINTSQQSKKMLFIAVSAQVHKDNRVDCNSVMGSKNSWIIMPEKSYDVPAETTIYAPFRLTVPSDFRSGEYQACLIAQEQPSAKPLSGVSLSTRVAMRLTVAPKHAQPPHLLLLDLATHYDERNIRITSYLRNLEPVTATSQISLTAKPAWPTALIMPKAYKKVLLPSSGAAIDISDINRPFWGGYYRFRLSVTSKAASSDWTDSKQAVTTIRETSIFLPPRLPALWIFAGIPLCLGGAALYIRKRSRR